MLYGDLDAESTEIVATALDAEIEALARPDDDRPLPERRADALVSMCRQYLAGRDDGAGPRRGRTHVSVVADIGALTGITDDLLAQVVRKPRTSASSHKRHSNDSSATARSAASSWTARARSSTSDGPPAPSTPRNGTRSSPATGTAPTPAAPAGPPTATPTTSSTGPKADPPTSPTSNSSAGNTTENNTSATRPANHDRPPRHRLTVNNGHDRRRRRQPAHATLRTPAMTPRTV